MNNLEDLIKYLKHSRSSGKKLFFNINKTRQYTLNRNERELVARLMEITIYNGFLPAALPSINISSEPPPIFIAYPELENNDENHVYGNNNYYIPRNKERSKTETITIENLLGFYKARIQQIIIFEKGIEWFVRKHSLYRECLFSVVLIHEISHWITHLLPKVGVPSWPTDLYILGEADVHEGWAQLMTWWVADQVKGQFKNTFEKLNKCQPSQYKVFEDFKKEKRDKIMKSLERLRLLRWPARLEDWKKAIEQNCGNIKNESSITE